MIAGHDIAGEVEAVGEGVSRFRVGDRIFAMRKAFSGGAHAELAVVPESSAALIPDGVSTEDAGVTPLAALTAWQVLHELGGLASGQRVNQDMTSCSLARRFWNSSQRTRGRLPPDSIGITDQPWPR